MNRELVCNSHYCTIILLGWQYMAYLLDAEKDNTVAWLGPFCFKAVSARYDKRYNVILSLFRTLMLVCMYAWKLERQSEREILPAMVVTLDYRLRVQAADVCISFARANWCTRIILVHRWSWLLVCNIQPQATKYSSRFVASSQGQASSFCAHIHACMLLRQVCPRLTQGRRHGAPRW